ncbi:ABC transporter substrate-binding protein [Rhodococcus gordoniae]|uniref:ABC transporter substrate-binding protein n=1 Tax=Rhodococcus gordoniae TaxID=223392 RepID=UPI0020CE1E37|nr:ABC transporter substrate-binding protein [Rhodococcus gordoniae]UTT51015.1 ABC transporter substrate-binding protein [Rhodococcus gordoniae]
MVAIGAMVFTGCTAIDSAGDSGGDVASQPREGAYGIVGDQGDGGPPVKGGTLTFAGLAPVTSLDPTLTQAAGSTGGTEMAAVYDVLMRYNLESQQFEPHLAESMEESEDRLTWTMKLRDDLTFSDGTPLDASAVVASIDRYNTRRGAHSQLYQEVVTSTTGADSSTVVFTLNRPWSNFPAMLSYGHGMVVAPSSQQGDTFTPIGAGPFTVVSLQPQQELQLKARPDYWGGAPNLDGLKFVAIAGDQPKIEALRTNGINMAYLSNAETVTAALEEFPGYSEPLSLKMVGQLNAAEGRPAADPRIRQAIAYAVDPEVLDARVREGKGMPGTEMFQAWSEWNSVPGIEPSSEEATRLLDEAKADGYDGKITFLSVNNPDSQELALAVQAQMNAVGFDTALEYASSTTDLVKRRFVDRDFDMSFGAYSLTDVDPEIRLYSALHSESTNNIMSYNSPQMDRLITEVLSASDDDAKREALGEVQTLINTDQPFVPWGAGVVFIPWTFDVYGVVPSTDGIMLLDEAFIAR